MSWIEKNTSESTKNLNFRTLIKFYDFYLYNNKVWKELALKQIEDDENLKIAREVIYSDRSVREQIEEFKTRTGKTERTYFRYKDMIRRKE